MANILSTAAFFFVVIVFGVFGVLALADAFKEGGVSGVQSMLKVERKGNKEETNYDPLSEFSI
ncbi:MAG: hypothetical protein QXU98_04085 [Candidatus Parvarchaeota archaeon]